MILAYPLYCTHVIIKYSVFLLFVVLVSYLISLLVFLYLLLLCFYSDTVVW